MTHRTVLEWGHVAVGEGGFTRREANELLHAARRHKCGGPDGTDILCDHHRFLRARQIVGVIAGRNCSLEILPKIDAKAATEKESGVRTKLVHMLDVAFDLKISSGETAAMARQADSLLEIFITLFADRLLAEVRRGLPRLYRTHEDNLRVLRGQLNVVRQFTVHAVRTDRLACRFDVLDSDIPLMQVMKACVLHLAPHARSTAAQRKLTELRFLFAGVRDIALSALPLGQARVERSSGRWRSLLDLAQLLLGDRWQQTHANEQAPEGFTLLFRMNELFERYVAAQIRSSLMGTEFDVVVQGGSAYCLGPWREGELVVGNSHPTRPDVLIKAGEKVVRVVDAKWKSVEKGVNHADVYQMMAYARIYKCPRLILIYPRPTSADHPFADTRGIPPGPDRIDVATVPIETRPSEIKAYLRRLVIDEERQPTTVG